MRRRALRLRLATAFAALLALLVGARCSSFTGTGPESPANDAGPATDALVDVIFIDPNITSPYARAVLIDAPLAYYRLDDDGGTAVDLVAGTSGAYGSATSRVAGLITDSDRATAFPGSDASVDPSGVVAVPRSSKLEPAQAITIECWFRVATLGALGDYQYLVSYGTDAVAPFQSWVIQIDGAHVEIYSAGLTTLSSGVTAVGGTALVPGQIYYLAATYDGLNLRMYLDGKQDGVAAAAGSLTYDGLHGLGIGGGFDGDTPLNGVVDEVAIYDHALTPSQIEAHYALGTAASGDL